MGTVFTNRPRLIALDFQLSAAVALTLSCSRTPGQSHCKGWGYSLLHAGTTPDICRNDLINRLSHCSQQMCYICLLLFLGPVSCTVVSCPDTNLRLLACTLLSLKPFVSHSWKSPYLHDATVGVHTTTVGLRTAAVGCSEGTYIVRRNYHPKTETPSKQACKASRQIGPPILQ